MKTRALCLAAFLALLLACEKREDPYKDLQWAPLGKVPPAVERPSRCAGRVGANVRLLRGDEIVREKNAAQLREDSHITVLEAEGRLGGEKALPLSALLEEGTVEVEVMGCHGAPLRLSREELLATPERLSLWPKPRGFVMLAEVRRGGRGNPMRMRDVFAVRLLRAGDAPTPDEIAPESAHLPPAPPGR
ncbi:MAG: hypothetical protein KDH09_19625 [Chrysiogenetes bacterium]|nr:hypothetical protein [Chrysiogenetes bacterium]